MKTLVRKFQSATSYRMLSTPMVARKSVRLILWSFAIILVTTLFTPWQQTATGYGKVMAFAPGDRVQLITANVEGRVAKWYVREGDKVKEGDVLAKMADNDPEILDRLRQEREAMVREIKALELSARAAEKNRERQKTLVKEGISSDRTFELSQMEHARFVKDLADSEGKLARLDVRISRQLMQEIRAPRAGVIQSILVGENNALVKPSDTIAQLVPATDERTVQLVIQGLDLPFIKVGQRVQLQFEGWPIFQFSGLPGLSIGTFSGVIRIIDPSDDGNGNFRIVVSRVENQPWPSHELLRQGVRARGWVQMNQVPLWFELWRQINGLPPLPVPLDVGPTESKNADEKADKKSDKK
jgi:multidrug efflux pump subunit AcrA (membrane-fusion protein)